MAPGLLLGSTSLELGLVFSYFLLSRVLLRKSLSPPLFILGRHDTHHTALSDVLPTRSLFADSDSPTSTQVTSTLSTSLDSF